MYPRLYVARELLKDDGVIFISIDDNEAAQLKLLCDEVLGKGILLHNCLGEKEQLNQMCLLVFRRIMNGYLYSQNLANLLQQLKARNDAIMRLMISPIVLGVPTT